MSAEQPLRASSAPRWFDRAPHVRRLLERIEVRQRGSAVILRAHGNEQGARQAERSASHVRLMLDHPRAVRRMHAFAQATREAPGYELFLDRALEGALGLLGAELGNVQIRDPATGALKIAAHCGFDRAFLEYFALVHDGSTACGRAAARGLQTVIVDVNADPGVEPHREIAAASGFRAVQSIPLIDGSGHVRGVISTHFRRSCQPKGRDLRLMAWYGELVAAALAAHQIHPPAVMYQVVAAHHEQAADRHEAVAALMQQRADTVAVEGQKSGDQLRAWSQLAQDRAVRERQRARTRRRLAEQTLGHGS